VNTVKVCLTKLKLNASVVAELGADEAQDDGLESTWKLASLETET
jgi:hypothetical protein